MKEIHSTNTVVENALRAADKATARNAWSLGGGADGQILQTPIPRSEYGKRNLDAIIEWAKRNSGDLAKYYTPSGVASQIIAAAEKAKRLIDEITKRKQADADAKFGRGRVRVPEQELPKTEAAIAKLRGMIADIRQRPEARREAARRDRAAARRSESQLRRRYAMNSANAIVEHALRASARAGSCGALTADAAKAVVANAIIGATI